MAMKMQHHWQPLAYLCLILMIKQHTGIQNINLNYNKSYAGKPELYLSFCSVLAECFYV